MEPLKRIGRYVYYRFIRARASPQEMARGLSIGLFVAFTPTFGVQSVASIFLAAVFRGNKILAGLAPFVTNPITMPFFYSGTYMVGAAILQSPLDTAFLSEPSLSGLWEAGSDIFTALWVGGILVGFVAGLIGYFVALSLGPKIQMKLARNKNQSRTRTTVWRKVSPLKSKNHSQD